MAEVAVFDLGNVLIRWDPAYMYDARIGPERRRALFDAVPIHDANLDVDRGADMATRFAALAEAYPEWAAEIALWPQHWLEMVPGEIAGTVALLERLRARGVPCYALSNFGAAALTLAEARHPVLTAFDGRIISAELGALKPEPEIYAALEALTGAAPEALFFTDDRPENIAAAAARGWATHLFTSPERLAEALVAEGLLEKS